MKSMEGSSFPSKEDGQQKSGEGEVLSSLEAGLRRRGIPQIPPREAPTQEPVEEKGDLRSKYDIARDRGSRITKREAEIKEAEDFIERQIAAGKVEAGLRQERIGTPVAHLERRPHKVDGRLEFFRKKGGRILRVFTLATLALMGSAAKQAEVYGATGSAHGISASKDAIPMKESGKETKKHATKWPGYVGRLFETDKNGKISFNPWVILAPVEVVWKGETRKASQKTFVLPYEYARQFEADAAAKRPLREEDHQKVADHMDQQLKQRFVDTVGGWAGSEGIQRFNYGEPQSRQGKITSIEITGFASPEGPRSRGPSTILGADKENIELAKKRAEAAVGYTKADLVEVSKATGAPMDVLEKTLQNAKGMEDGFSDQELKDLASLASTGGYKGVDDLEKIWNMVGDYNDKKITDPHTVSRLHDIVGSKRRVEITVTYDGKNEERTALPLPIPWVPLLFLAPLLRRRREGASPVPQGVQEAGEPDARDRYPVFNEGLRRRGGEPEAPQRPQEAQEPQEPSGRDVERGQILERIHKNVIDTRLPDRGTKEFQEMEEATYTDDLYLFFDDPESIRLGINYRVMADDLDRKWDVFQGSDERENYLANGILNSWKKKDRQCRVEAGVSEDGLDAGLDYENQPRQIQWAKMHARSLLRLVDKRKEFSESERKRIDYLDLMSPQVKKMIQRRGSR